VATIAVAQCLAWLTGPTGIPKLFNDKDLSGAARPPVDFRFHFDVSVFHLADLLVILTAAAAMVGLAAFFRHSRTGVAVRASAENADRAASLGVDNTRVAAVVWCITGLLSGLAATLAVMGGSPTGGGGTSSLVHVLAAPVPGGLTRRPPAGAAARGVA